ncbi:MAG: integrase arm-type DNA-binding domain-containing protein [Deltaproteobacteria bacterium]|nr:integrase arm-type DNA-binding domain-containing protein [Deltaproteobacteria bacterium]
MPLTDYAIKHLKATGMQYRKADGGGLYLIVTAQGRKYWRMDYRFQRTKRLTISFGEYPAVSLTMARKHREKAKELLAQGINPMDARREEAAQALRQSQAEKQTFQRTALEWFEKQMADKSEGYRRDVWQRLEKHIFPQIGDVSMASLEPRDILAALEPLSHYRDLQGRMYQLTGQICRYALLMKYTAQDPSYKLSEYLPKAPPVVHRSAIIDPAEVGRLMLAIESYPGDVSMRYALRLMSYLFVRSGELRGARWPEIDLKAATWTIPAARMKMKRDHLVPLSRQSLKLFGEMEPFRRRGDLVFPSQRDAAKPLTSEGLRNALIRMGYDRKTMCIHGFRAMARTMLHERLHFSPDAIEAQLAHSVPDRLGSAYNRAQHLEERTRMMQEWADYLDSLREQARQQLEKENEP